MHRQERYIKFFITILLLLGIVLRLIYYFQDYDLIIDEANIARNLFERNFAELFWPLSYEQYAPPVFMWIEKLVTLGLGFSEKALRFYPLLCGIASMFVFYKILLRSLTINAYWYPLALLSMGTIYVKYSAQVKQYMPDMLIALLLIWAALVIDIQKVKKNRFILFWTVAGSIAVWTSMSSVFILAGIGCYYGWQCLKLKEWKMIWNMVIPVLIWIGQFMLYYALILKSQISSDYLQHYHDDYFLFLFPSNGEEWMHNAKRLKSVMGEMGGFSFVSLAFNILLLLIGIYTMIKERMAWIWLFGLPVLLVLLAAALRQYSLIERLILFMLPLGLVLVGFGLEKIMRLKSKALRISIVVIALVVAGKKSMAGVLWHYYGFNEITYGLNYLKDHRVDGAHLFVHDACGPTYIYYTAVHPDKKKWEELEGAHILKWDDDYTVETKEVQDTVYFLYTGGFSPVERKKRTTQIEEHLKQVDYYEKYICFVFAYAPK